MNRMTVLIGVAGTLAAAWPAPPAAATIPAEAPATAAALSEQGQGKGQQGEARGRGQGQGGGEARGQGRGSTRAARPQQQEARGRSGERGQGQGNRGQAQGRGQSTERPQARGRSAQTQERGQSVERRQAARPERGRAAERAPSAAPGEARGARTSVVRGRAASAERLFGGAVTRARSRGAEAGALGVRSDNDRVRLVNRRGDVLVDMERERAREIGAWRLRRLGDQRPRGNAPAFCRSGEGHPVWGREWCLDKGFGLGSRAGTLWSRGRIDDIIFRRTTDRARLDRGGLIGVLGDIVFGRLALQAVTLGYDQPLTGVWVAEPSSPRILRVYSGGYPVAELVDLDRDDRAEVLYVVQPL